MHVDIRTARLPTSLLIVGAEGFLGTHVLKLALATRTVRVVALCTHEPWRWTPANDRLQVEVLAVPWWQAQSHVQRLATGVEAIALLPWTPPPPGADPLAHELAVNMAGVESLATAGAAAGARLVFPSSAEVYADRPGERLDEKAPRAPTTPFAVGKSVAEQVVAAAGTLGGTVLRLGTVFGPGELRHRPVPDFITALLRRTRPKVDSEGGDVRDYVGVRDTAQAVLLAAGLEGLGWRTLNVGTGVGRSTGEVLATVAWVLGTQASPRYHRAGCAARHHVLDPTELGQVLGVRPSTDFEAGVVEEVRWLRRRVLRIVDTRNLSHQS